MSWFNYIGLIIMCLIMIPNIIYSIKHKTVDNPNIKKSLLIMENIGRYSSMFFMVFNIPYTWTGFLFDNGLLLYIGINAVLVIGYIVLFIVFFNKNGIVKNLSLSLIPTLIFFISGALIISIPLLISSILFGISHIIISLTNSEKEEEKKTKKATLTLVFIVAGLLVSLIGILGGNIMSSLSRLKKLESMSYVDMIKYDAYKDKKISVAIYNDGSWNVKTYIKDAETSDIYDFEIGSISKTFVGLYIAKLESEGKLSLSDSISKYLDLDDSKYYPTIERLLTHTSGYKPYYFESEFITNKLSHKSNNDYYGIEKEKILKRIKNTKLENKDYSFEYSNFGISVLGLVIESICHDSFINIMNKYIKEELSLSQTNSGISKGNLDRYMKWKETDGYLPAGAIMSNINEMCSYLNVYLNNTLPYARNTYLNHKEISNANNPTYLKLGIRMDSIGMTWIHDDSLDFNWHNGGTTNYNSYIAFSDDLKCGVIILSNLGPNERISMTVIGSKIMSELNK